QVEQFIESIFPSQGPEALQRGTEAAKPVEDPQVIKEREEAKWDMSKESNESPSFFQTLTHQPVYMLIAVMGTLFLLSCIMIGIAYFLGARFDVAAKQLKEGNFKPPSGNTAKSIADKYDRGEL
ncbi:MAG: hypothetical protein Q9224_007760, partial [Gallowayella concinna]